MSVAEAVRMMVLCTRCVDAPPHRVLVSECTRSSLAQVYRLNRESPEMGDPDHEALVPRIRAREIPAPVEDYMTSVNRRTFLPAAYQPRDETLMRRMENVDRRRWDLKASVNAWQCPVCHKMNPVSAPRQRDDYIHWTRRPAQGEVWSERARDYYWTRVVAGTESFFVGAVSTFIAMMISMVVIAFSELKGSAAANIAGIVFALAVAPAGGFAWHLYRQATQRQAQTAAPPRDLMDMRALGRPCDIIGPTVAVVLTASLAVLTGCFMTAIVLSPQLFVKH